ncbi:MAG: SEC-C domain-containing protein [Clostridia bacterium]|nr:SEC-C domain-containing protein [Clostridia bacterium]
MRLFGGEKIQGFVSKMGMEEDEAIEANMLTKSIENAQKRVEGRNFSIRKYVLQYDDVMNKQREVIYNERRRVLEGENLRSHVMGMFESIVDDYIAMYTVDAKYPEEWDLESLNKVLQTFIPDIKLKFDNLEQMELQDLKDYIMSMEDKAYEIKEEEIQPERMRELERVILLRVVDTKWMDHIDAMDQLKQGIGLRAVGHEDPVRAYQNEGFDMFEAMIKSIQEDTVKYMLNVTLNTDTERKQVVKIGEAQKESFRDDDRSDKIRIRAVPDQQERKQPEQKQQPIKKEKTVGRNEPCPCGSGKKYKKCCAQKQNEDRG